MSKLVLHIGTHKTATTTIQSNLFRHRKQARKHGLIYPDLPGQHHGLVADWINLPEFYHYPGGAEQHWRHITKVNKDSDKTVIISAEEMSRATEGNRVNFAQLREWTDGFDRVEVVCFLRDQLSLIQSIFFQMFRKHPNMNWNKLLKEAFEEHRATGLFLNYNHLYDYILENFDPEEVTFLPYSSEATPNSDPLDRLLSHLGFSHLIDDMSLEDANRSQSPLPTWISSQINAPNGFDPDLAEAIHGAFDKKRTFMYSRGEAQKVINVFEPVNKEFSDRYRNFALEDLKMADVNDSEYIFRDGITNPIWINISRTMLHTKASATKA